MSVAFYPESGMVLFGSESAATKAGMTLARDSSKGTRKGKSFSVVFLSARETAGALIWMMSMESVSNCDGEPRMRCSPFYASMGPRR